MVCNHHRFQSGEWMLALKVKGAPGWHGRGSELRRWHGHEISFQSCSTVLHSPLCWWKLWFTPQEKEIHRHTCLQMISEDSFVRKLRSWNGRYFHKSIWHLWAKTHNSLKWRSPISRSHSIRYACRLCQSGPATLHGKLGQGSGLKLLSPKARDWGSALAICFYAPGSTEPRIRHCDPCLSFASFAFPATVPYGAPASYTTVFPSPVPCHPASAPGESEFHAPSSRRQAFNPLW